jgi:uncharacterized RDD family membrane protein YckC
MSGLTPGDPLGETAPPREPWERVGYTTEPPPGAGGPVPSFSGGLSGAPVLSGWWRRVGAQLIDGFIVAVGAAILFVAITAPFSIGFFANDTVGWVAILVGALLAVLCVAVVALLYAPAMMARTNGKTVGRSALGIRVIRANGEPMTFGVAFVREVVVKSLLVGTLASLTFGLAWLLDVLWPLWDEENRALHDFLVDTRTIED